MTGGERSGGRPGAGIVVLLALLGAAVAVWAALELERRARPAGGALVASGFVEVTEVPVAAEAGGRVVEAAAEEGRPVRAGEMLFRLDAAALEQQVRLAEAQVRQARARYEEAAAGARAAQVRQAQAALDQARARLEEARANADRVAALLREGAATQAQVDQARSQLRQAEEQEKAAAAALELVRAGATDPALRALAAAADQAEAALALAWLNRDRATVRAPLDGVFVRRLVEVGEVVQPGARLGVVAELGHPWVRVYVPEADLGRVRLGQAASVTVDAYPGRSFAARVRRIASQAEFTPRNVQTRRGRADLVFAVTLDVADPRGLLRAGLPADVTFAEEGAP